MSVVGVCVWGFTTDTEMSHTSTKRQSTNCIRSFVTTESGRLCDGLSNLMVRMRGGGGGLVVMWDARR